MATDAHLHDEHARRGRLSRDLVVRTALRLMDEEGLEAVTMRRVAHELGVEAMSLYHHVRDKEDLLGGVIEAVMAEFPFPEDHPDWREAGRRTARAWRALLKAHPHVITLMAHRREPLLAPAALRPMDHALSVLRRAGLSGLATVRAFRAFGSYIQGFVLAEVAHLFGGEAEAPPPDLDLGPIGAELPTLAAHLRYLLHCDFDEEFEHGLDLMIRGLEAELASEGQEPSPST